MSTGIGKCSKIQYIVRLRQMLRRWRAKAAAAAKINAGGGAPPGLIPADVPAGHVAVSVGTNSRRFVVRATYLNHPLFKKLLVQAEEEFGFGNSGPLAIPCDESVFEEILRFVSRKDSGSCNGNGIGNVVRSSQRSVEELKRCCSQRSVECWVEARPLLHGLAEKSVW
ncbi:Auxin-induced protein [Cinnamomum micranthum f. kanehirae]|uniref:Auxin-induced protein n=1 Tax=Cinnamomum micranthum f. kanehirae TaxID=337451 RepID=A0A443P582_9MAGN|nr:Auxin-induced protein [Cinnamomum micranthum f. kanehirae]